MKTYILKYTVFNHIEFPIGTVVKLLPSESAYDTPSQNFEVVRGKLTGVKGSVVDGLNGWLFENTTAMRARVKDYLSKQKALETKAKELTVKYNKIDTVVFSQRGVTTVNVKSWHLKN